MYEFLVVLLRVVCWQISKWLSGRWLTAADVQRWCAAVRRSQL